MDGVDVGRLLTFATDPAASPGSSGDPGEYSRLVQRYLGNATFRRLFDDVVEGVDCVVADAGPQIGVVLRARLRGPWAWPERSTDLPWAKGFLGVEERVARMLVVPALLAYVAPSAADLDDLLGDPTIALPPVAVRELEQFIRGFAEHAEAAASDPIGTDRPAWWHWVQMSADAPTRTGKRAARVTTTFVVHDVLQFLHGLGLLVKVSGSAAADSVYRPRRRLLLHYADLLVDDLFTALRSAAGPAPGGG